MVEPFHSVAMTTHPCYTFYQRMLNCVKTEEFHSRMCFVEKEDWLECKSRKKHRAFENYIGNEMQKLHILSLPTYEPKTDTFKDGPLPRNVDGYFSKDKHLQKYYTQTA